MTNCVQNLGGSLELKNWLILTEPDPPLTNYAISEKDYE